MFQSPIFPVVLIAGGILYLIKPDIFQRWFYMRLLGAAFIVIGVVLLFVPGRG